jgi:hypothetical protein
LQSISLLPFFQGSTGKYARLTKGELTNDGNVGVIEYAVSSMEFQDMTDSKGVEGLEVLWSINCLESREFANKQHLF